MATNAINLPSGFIIDSQNQQQMSPNQGNMKLPQGFVLDSNNSSQNVPNGVQIAPNGRTAIMPKADLKTNILNALPLPNVSPQQMSAGINRQPQLVKDLETIPTNFLNQISMNHLRSSANADNVDIPFEAKNPLINAAAKTAGVAGMVMSPLNKLAFMKALGPGKLLAKAGQGAIAGAAYAPNDNPANIGGRALQAAGGAVIGPALTKLENIPQGMRNTSARLYDWMVKLPTKAFNYSKDPMAVFTKEKVTGNSITDLAANFEDRLAQRTNELNLAVENNNKTIDISKAIDSNLELAASKAKGSLKDRTNNLIELQTVKDRLAEQYGDLSKITISNAIKLKRQLAEDFPFTNETRNDINTKAAHKAYRAINESVEKASLEIADLNQRVSGLIDITKAAKNRMAIESRNNPLGLIHSLLGIGAASTVGHVAGGIEGSMAGLGAAVTAKAISSPAVLSRVAKGLSIMADADKLALFKAYPEFKNIAIAAMQGKNKLNVPRETPNFSPISNPAVESPKTLNDLINKNLDDQSGKRKLLYEQIIRFKNKDSSNIGGNKILSLPKNGNFKVDKLGKLKNNKGQILNPATAMPSKMKELTSLIDSYKTEPEKFYHINKLPVSDAVKGHLVQHYNMNNLISNSPKQEIGWNDVVPSDAMRILNNRFSAFSGSSIPSNLTEKGITLKKLIQLFESIGGGEEIVKESTIALRKLGYRKIGNIKLTKDGAVPEINNDKGIGATGLSALAVSTLPKDSKSKRISGEASTYGWGEKLNSHTFDGNKFDANKVGVAMRDVPMGTVVEILDKKTGKKIEATVIDGGPNKRTKRVIDLTKGAWKKLGYDKPGLTQVEVNIKKTGKGRSFHQK